MFHRLFLLLMLLLSGCGLPDYDPSEDEHVGEAARSEFSLCDEAKLPATISDEWVFDGGSSNGMIYYLSFKCESTEDCWTALDAFRAPDRAEFTIGVKTGFAVNKYGPNFYWPDFDNPKWNVASITNGVFYETARDDRGMDFWAIDLDDLRVYFHHESGGFPDDPPTKRHR
ncbi:MAG: hypothetical protein ACI9HK_005530 [Pirellulaceae bacterium]|jgi:hypothetical protein